MTLSTCHDLLNAAAKQLAAAPGTRLTSGAPARSSSPRRPDRSAPSSVAVVHTPTIQPDSEPGTALLVCCNQRQGPLFDDDERGVAEALALIHLKAAGHTGPVRLDDKIHGETWWLTPAATAPTSSAWGTAA